ncbi:MAG: ABC transporter [Crocinitomicaceae bacterium]|nr:ABC transporter [Crocinitomicaceae bacterium]|tara:strand:+ start:5259 stop:8276 length:3018 start_codon:yes stop_codon:yes gene_type:complete
MSEELLKALMKLFALASDVDDLNHQSRVIVENYLKQELNAQLVPTYVELYDKYIQEIHHGNQSSEEALSTENVKEVCTKINTVLEQRQKIVILIRLLEYILADENVSEHEFQFLLTSAKVFNIPVDEFENCLKFIEADSSNIPDLETVLVIDSKEATSLKKVKHLQKEGVEGVITVLKFPSVDMFLLRHFGEGNLILNGQIIFKERAYILTGGSSLRGNNLNPIFYSDIVSSFLVREEKEKIVFKASDIEYRFRTGNIGMQPFKMCEENGRLIGIMGGSGAGKSTLLNILNGNYVPNKGQVTINGINIYTDKDKIEGVIGYVSQDDLLIEELTVFQNLYYNSKLIFGKKSNEEITTLVMDLLESLGLKDTAGLKVGSPMDKYISGGQRKRLNIALELIREPSLLFVDEPTSGLSSRDSQNIMDLLKELSLKGKLIYVVIHQPSSDIFKMFDKLIILDVGGYVVYNGNPVEGIKYFKRAAKYANADNDDPSGNVNPEVIFNIIDQKVIDEYGNLTHNRKVSPEQWFQLYNENIDSKVKMVEDPPQAPEVDFNLANVFSQFKTFVTRDILSKLTNRQYLLINLLEAPVLALILSYFVRYYPFAHTDQEYIFLENENIPVYLFMAVVVSLFIGLTVAAEEIIRDQKIRKREQFLNLNRGAYLISKILIMFLISAIQTTSFLLVGNSILHVDGMFGSYFIVLFTSACFANVLGLNISASFNSAVTIYILIPFIIIPQLIFSGVLVKFDKLNPSISSKTVVPMIGEVMASRWAFEALAVNQFINNKFERHLYAHEKTLSMANYKKVYWIPELESKVSLLENSYKDPERTEEVQTTLDLVRNEVTKQNKTYPKLAYQNMEELSSIGSLSAQVFGNLRDFLRLQRTFYNKLYNKTLDDKDEVISHLRKSDEFDFGELKMKYRNNSLADLVTNKNELSKIETIKNNFVQLEDPIYRDSQSLRGHFYAPRKRVFGKYFDTLWVNVCVIWFMTILLVITLFLDAFRKFINLFDKK